MTEFRVTFGGKYRDQPHPVVPYAHPEGWVAVEAADHTEARTTVVAMIGPSFCDLYGPDADVDWSWFPRGELARIHPDRSVTVANPYAELARLREALEYAATHTDPVGDVDGATLYDVRQVARRALGITP